MPTRRRSRVWWWMLGAVLLAATSRMLLAPAQAAPLDGLMPLAQASADLPVVANQGPFNMMEDLAKPALLCLVFTLLGMILFAACIWLVVRVTPFSVRKEIEEDQNVALGIIIGSMILGIAMILSAALLG